MEYNTQREQLKIADYGRNVAKLIEQCKRIPDRAERTKMANSIVDTMAQVNPKVKERSDYRHTLWDHMMFIANYELDVDTPFPVKQEEPTQMHPRPIARREGRIRYPHYGRTLEGIVRAVSQMPESNERTLLTQQIAHTMKRLYLQWNRDSVDDLLIEEQLSQLSEGRLKLPVGFKFHDTQYYIDAIAAAQARKEAVNKKKKKKKKKDQNN